MLDCREDVFKILKTISPYVYHCNVDDYKNTNYPKITYQLKNNVDIDFRDGEAYANLSEFVIQVFEKTISGDLKEIHEEVIEKFKKEGYKRIFFDFFRDVEDDIYIYTLRFSKINYY